MSSGEDAPKEDTDLPFDEIHPQQKRKVGQKRISAGQKMEEAQWHAPFSPLQMQEWRLREKVWCGYPEGNQRGSSEEQDTEISKGIFQAE